LGQRIDYNHAIQGELVLAPTEEARTALQEDYEAMIEEGLFFRRTAAVFRTDDTLQ